MKRIQVGWDDGMYWWRDVDDAPGWHHTVDIPIWRYWWLKFIAWLDRPVDRYLKKLDNQIFEERDG